MKFKVVKSQLQHRDDIWSILADITVENAYPTTNPLLDEISIVFSYYSELESGGHESLTRWQYDQIVALGFETYLDKLTATLRKIGAVDYAVIEKDYLPDIWRIYHQLENGENMEEAFYVLVEKADKAYVALQDAIRPMLVEYAVDIHLQVIEPVEES